MLIGYFKGEPTDFVIEYSAGDLRRQGPGLAFWYPTWKTSIAVVPTGTVDANFVFQESTANHQTVTIQGQVTYRIVEPPKMARILNFTVDPRTKKYLSEDPEKLSRRVINAVQVQARAVITALPLTDALASSDALAATVQKSVQDDPLLVSMGVDVLGVHVASIKPTPELAKALEAEYREALQRQADEAIYARRAAAVESERKISENEVASKIALENQRQELVDLEGANERKLADFQSAASAARLAPFRDMDPRVLLGMGFKELGERAASIQSISITPDILAALREAK
jgi:regulator of protease activity HflC (stomatin/prohibitin superfamily)